MTNGESKFELPISDDNGVIKFKIVRRDFTSRRRTSACWHRDVTIDTLLSQMMCRVCGAYLNPIEWIAMHVEMWQAVRRLYEQQQQAAKMYEGKTRTKCEHCGEMTRVRPARSLRAVMEDD